MRDSFLPFAPPLVGEEEINEVVKTAKQGALAKMTVFPGIMLLCYIALILYFRSQGGYKAQSIGGGGH